MSTFAVEQALFLRQPDAAPALRAHSPGFRGEWLAEAERIVAGFGKRPPGVRCPAAVFAQPLGKRHVAVVQAADQDDGALGFRFLVLERRAYEGGVGDPFAFAERLPPDWHASELAAIDLPAVPVVPRTVAQVQAVLRRVKAAALRDDEDPEHPDFERTVDNSESPALLGGAQVLMDGGRLIFERPEGDPALVAGLWTLLPDNTRARLWPASFAFGNDLGFDVAVLPRVRDRDLEGYTTEEQAAEYPPGSYELALQTAAETGSQRDLDAVFRRRNSGEVIRLGLTLVVGLALIVGLNRWIDFGPPDARQPYKAAAAAGMVGAGDPWTATGLVLHGNQLFLKDGPR